MDALALPLIEAHRGDCANAPENTLAAFQQAIALGVPSIELDIHPSSDGSLMVIHDTTVDRTTNATGHVAHMATARLQQLDAGSHFSPAFAGQTIPLLTQVFELVAPTDTRLNIEIKSSPANVDVPRILIDLLRTFNRQHRDVVSSFDLPALLAVRAIAPQVTLALIGKAPDILPLALQHDLPWIHAEYRTLDASLIARAHAHHIRVNAWTVDDPQQARRLCAIGIDKICTNAPATIQAACHTHC